VSVLLGELLDAVGEIAAACAPGEARPVLIGGLGVNLQISGPPTARAQPLRETLDDPAGLAASIRPTQDIDICVSASEVAALRRCLGAIGFTKVTNRAAKFERGPLRVDVLTTEYSLAGVALGEGMSEPLMLASGRAPAAVASRPALVVTKCEACWSRRGPRPGRSGSAGAR
jgi:hypothetical protein